MVARLPTEKEIYEKAVELFLKENPAVYVTPEKEELKEGSYWDRARLWLMYDTANLARQEMERARAEELDYYFNLVNELMNQLEELKEAYERYKAKVEELERKRVEMKPYAPPKPTVQSRLLLFMEAFTRK